MPDVVEVENPAANVERFERVAKVLGGQPVLRHELRTALDAHEMLLDGLPGAALLHLVDTLAMLQKPQLLEKAIGMSLRTFQRRKGAPGSVLNPEQSGRTWTFAELLAKATAVLGSQEAAEAWFECPAIGLDQRRPIDLLATPAGVSLVEEFLERVEYGVYV